jgi:hypothetical protein
VELHLGRAQRLRERFAGATVTVIQSDALSWRLPHRPFRGHCCIEANVILAVHQSSEVGPSSTLENRNKLGIRRPATSLLGGHADQF